MSRTFTESENSRKSSARGKVTCDKKAKGVMLQPGDRVLVRNLSERGGPGKLRAYWEKTIYIIKEQLAESPVYILYPEKGDKQKTRTLHCNLLLLVNDLPVEVTPSHDSPTAERKTCRIQRQQKVTDMQKQTDSSENSESGDDGNSGYWLRLPRTEERIDTYQEQNTVDQRNQTTGHEKETTRRGNEHSPVTTLTGKETQTGLGTVIKFCLITCRR